jgi:crotonobetainyl-CoA:carnitine CoA-transferase CaiB-like acyl-CoA transferase
MEALSDITVIDLTASFWASAGTALLADFGADVMQVEEEERGKKEEPLPGGTCWRGATSGGR